MASKSISSQNLQLNLAFPEGALSLLHGPEGGGKTETTLRSLFAMGARRPSRQDTMKVAWVEEKLSIYPRAFLQTGIDLRGVLFVEAGTKKNLLWSAQQLIRSQVFNAVVISGRLDFDENVLRRLQIDSEKNSATVIFLSDVPFRRGTWPLSLHVEVRRINDGKILIHTLKDKRSSSCSNPKSHVS